MTPTLLLATALATPLRKTKPPVDIRPKTITNLDAGLSGASFEVLEVERTRTP